MMFSLVLTFNHQKSKLRKHLGTGGLGDQKKGHNQQTGLNHQKIKPTKKRFNEKKNILPSQDKILPTEIAAANYCTDKMGTQPRKKGGFEIQKCDHQTWFIMVTVR